MDLNYPEGATPLDPDEKAGLKLPHVTTREELNTWEQRNITEAYDWLDRTRNKDILSEHFVRTLHIKMLGKVWEWAGDFRRSNKNIGVDWPQISVELKQLLEDAEYWIDHETYGADEISARFHHRLVYIHLFPNGNGRHARMITDHLLMEKFDSEPFTWGSGNLVDKGDVRKKYIAALRAADRHHYQPLLHFIRS